MTIPSRPTTPIDRQGTIVPSGTAGHAPPEHSTPAPLNRRRSTEHLPQPRTEAETRTESRPASLRSSGPPRSGTTALEDLLSRRSGELPESSTALRPHRPAGPDIDVSGEHGIHMGPVGSTSQAAEAAAVPADPATVRLQNRQAARQAQLAGQQALLAQSSSTATFVAVLLGSLGVASNTGGTFGAARGTGKELSMARVSQLENDQMLGLFDTLPKEQQDLGKDFAKSIAGWAAGAGLGGVGSVISQVGIAPVVVGVISMITGMATQSKVNLEHVYPDPDPLDATGQPKSEEQYGDDMREVQRLRTEARQVQDGFTIKDRPAKTSGDVSFAGLHGLRAAMSTLEKFQKPGVGTRIGLSTLASGGAGFFTGVSLEVQKARATVPVDIGGVQHQLPLFATTRSDPTGIAQGLKTAVNAFTGGRTGGEAALHAFVQVCARAAGIAVATMVDAVAQPAADAIANRIDPESDAARTTCTVIATVLAYVAAVEIWFTLLPKIQARQVQPQPITDA
jgi:hypothetical protein